MTLARLMYVSTIGKDVAPEAVNRIIDVAKVENAKRNITGLLCFNRKYFLQVLEGERNRVSELFLKIAADPRHHKVVLTDFSEIYKRDFPTWSMGYIPESGVGSSILMKYSCDSNFMPYDMPSQSQLEMMLAMRANVKMP